jgi:hypothetical protein
MQKMGYLGGKGPGGPTKVPYGWLLEYAKVGIFNGITIFLVPTTMSKTAQMIKLNNTQIGAPIPVPILRTNHNFDALVSCH